MADFNNAFSGVRSLANSNTEWVKTAQKLMDELASGIAKHVDNIEYVIKNVDKSDYEISDLQNIYSKRLDVYEAIVNLMIKINESAKAEIEIQKSMCEKERQKYEDVFDALKQQIEES